MAKNIEPKLKKIGEYLKLEEDAQFIIPEYQRAYSWGTGHCDKLWQDIIDYSGNGRKDSYFFGTIIINCQEHDTELELIDGQQRTTTFLLLLKALLIRINTEIERTPNDDDSARLLRGLRDRRRKIMEILYRAEAEEVSDDPNTEKDRLLYSRSIILTNKSNNEQYSSDLEIILQASDFAGAEAKVKKFKYKQGDNKYTNFFRNFKFFYNKIVNELFSGELNSFAKTLTDNCEVIEIRSWQVEQAINMFNSLNSDGLPLYDSDIISAKLYAAANGLGVAEDYSKLWTELKSEITALEEIGIADINAILMQYMYYVRTIRRETVSAGGKANVTTPGLRRYFIQENTAPIANPIGMCADMLKLVKAWKKVAAYSLVKILLKFNENAKLFLASYLLRLEDDEMTPENVEPIVECLLRLFAVLELEDIGYSSKNFKMFLFLEEVKLADKDVTIEALKQDFADHIHKNWTRTKIADAAKDYDGNMLVYLNEYLFAKEHGVGFDLGAKYDIEHIMPHSGNNLQVIQQDAGMKDKDEFIAFVNKLGNKIILEERINRSIGNEWFRTKVSTCLHEKTGYIDSLYPIAAHLVDTYRAVEKPYWTKADIASATERASNRIVEFIFAIP